jgi:hypothetical protein
MAPKVGGLVARMPLAVNFLLAARCFFAVLPEINSELTYHPERIIHFWPRTLADFRCFTRCFVAENSEKPRTSAAVIAKSSLI